MFEVTERCAITSCHTIPCTFIAAISETFHPLILGMDTWAGVITFDHAFACQRWQLKPDLSMNIIFYLALGTFSEKIKAYTLHFPVVLSFSDHLIKMHTLM